MKHYSMYEILNALKAQENMPYSLYADAKKRVLDTVTGSPSYAWFLPAFQKHVETYAVMPIEAPSYQALADWKRRGQRGNYDRTMYALRTRLNRMWMAVLADVPGAKPLLEDILYAFLNLDSWSLSAHHFDNVLEDHWDIPMEPLDGTGRIRGMGRSRHQCLDLCSCSAAAILSEMTQTLEGIVDDNLLRWARQECFERVLKPFMSLAPFPHFEINPNNWSGVCMGSIGIAAIYLITNPDTLAPVLMRVLEGMQVHENGYNEDGASPEGFGYWQYGFEYTLMFADLLKMRTGGRIDLLKDEKLRRVAGFGTDCCFGPSIKLPFGDCNWRGVLDEAVRRYVGSMGVSVCPEGDTEKSFNSCWEHGNLMLRYLVWTMQPEQKALAYPRSAVYPKSELFMGFYRTPGDELYLVAKGGNNGESHNHNDVGTFVIIRGDRMAVADTAGGAYCKDYFSEKRYTYFATRSGGHNFPIVDGVEQEGHGRCRCKRFEVTQGESADEVFMDLTGTLKADALTSFTRKIRAERSSGEVCVTDTFELARAASVRDRLIVPGLPEKAEGGLMLPGGVKLMYDESALSRELAHVDQKLEGSDIYTLDLIPKCESAGTYVITMRFTAE
ncbi:MAG: heparinase II/III family protein [Clostridia bacterium]|nr:heparinase II/III family protein [Clostridia bacterium]